LLPPVPANPRRVNDLAPFQLIELHSVLPARAGLQDIELARISQRIAGIFATGQRGRGPQWVMNGPKATSALSPFDSQLRTLVGAARRSHSCRDRKSTRLNSSH